MNNSDNGAISDSARIYFYQYRTMISILYYVGDSDSQEKEGNTSDERLLDLHWGSRTDTKHTHHVALADHAEKDVNKLPGLEYEPLKSIDELH